MTKPQDKTTQQLELRLLMDLNSRVAPVSTLGVTGNSKGGSDVVLEQAASDKDLAVYKQMSVNYFSSLQKA